MKKKIETSVRINASRETIWQVLTNFEKYPEWNSFIKSVSGNVEEGNQINVVLQGMKFKPQVLKFDKNTEFKWLGSLWFKACLMGSTGFT